MLNNILDLLRSDGSIVINKSIAHRIGLEETIIYAELISQFKFWESRKQLVNGEWFFCTIEKLELHTTIKRSRQTRIINRLVELELIEVKQMGLPSKRHFRITNKIFELLTEGKSKVTQNKQADEIGVYNEKGASNQHHDQVTQNEQTSLPKYRKLDNSKRATSNNIFNNNDLEEEDIYITLINKNEKYKKLERILKSKKIKDKTINQTIIELAKRKVDDFTLGDVEKQVTHMVNKRDSGERIYNFAMYFANGLEELSEQTRVLQDETKKQKTEKRDTSVYFDWLKE